jgi:hypothetical protein
MPAMLPPNAKEFNRSLEWIRRRAAGSRGAEATRPEALGARRLPDDEVHEGGTTWVVMADPEGNELCVCDAGAGSAG